MNNCGSKMTVAQLKVAVKAKFPKLAVSKLNKPALLDYLEGRKRANPKFPKLAPAIVKKLDASKKAGFGNTPKVAALVKGVKAGISAKKVSTMIDSVKAGMAAKKATPAPKKDNLPFHLMMNIRKMATDSSRNDKENPEHLILKEQQSILKYIKDKKASIVNDGETKGSFTQLRRDLENNIDTSVGRYVRARQGMKPKILADYIKLHKMGFNMLRPIFMRYFEFTLNVNRLLGGTEKRIRNTAEYKKERDKIEKSFDNLKDYLLLDKFGKGLNGLSRKASMDGYRPKGMNPMFELYEEAVASPKFNTGKYEGVDKYYRTDD